MYSKQRKLVAQLNNIELTKDLSEEEVIDAARLLCSGPSGTREKSLVTLKNAFILDKCHIISFMKVEGALHAIVGYLMSKNPMEQLLAAECCSNMAMGDSKTCLRLAKAAAPYIITILQGVNHNLMDVCLISLFNMCGSGDQICEILYSQGILNDLERTLTVPLLRENSLKTLISFTKNGSKYLSESEVTNLLTIVSSHFEQSDKAQWLVYQLSSFPNVLPTLIKMEFPLRTLSLLSTIGDITEQNIVSATSLVRILGNLNTDPCGVTASTILKRWGETRRIFKFFFNCPYHHLTNEVYWAIGNIIRHVNPNVQNNMGRIDFSGL